MHRGEGDYSNARLLMRRVGSPRIAPSTQNSLSNTGANIRRFRITLTTPVGDLPGEGKDRGGDGIGVGPIAAKFSGTVANY